MLFEDNFLVARCIQRFTWLWYAALPLRHHVDRAKPLPEEMHGGASLLCWLNRAETAKWKLC